MKNGKKPKSILKGASFFLATFAFVGLFAMGTRFVKHGNVENYGNEIVTYANDGDCAIIVYMEGESEFDESLFTDELYDDSHPAFHEYGTDTTIYSPAKEGYVFLGWYENSDFSGDPITQIPASREGNYGDEIVLYARWAEIFGISVDAGITQATVSASASQAEGSLATVTVSDIDTGYELATLYYIENSDVDETHHSIDVTTKQFTMPATDVTVYATFTAISYTITVNGLELTDTYEGTIPANYTIESSAITLPSEVTRTGYTFTGWTYEGQVTPIKNVTILAGSTGNKEYTANFTKDTYAIGYTLNGGAVANENPTTYQVDTAAITLNNPTKLGYTFIGWIGTDLTGNTMTVTIPTNSTGNRTYTANWQATSYTITVNGLEGTDAYEGTIPANYTIESSAITLPSEVTRTGYTFTGWTYEGQVTPIKNVTILAGSTGDKTYTANFIKADYTISFNLNGGTVDGTNPTTYQVGSEEITLINPTKLGYTFIGWTYEGQNTPISTVVIPEGSIGDIELTANFAPTKYKITYDLGEGEVEIENPSEYTIESRTFTLVNPTKKGYIFKGWREGDSEELIENVTIESGSTGDKHYTAVWEVDKTNTYVSIGVYSGIGLALLGVATFKYVGKPKRGKKI